MLLKNNISIFTTPSPSIKNQFINSSIRNQEINIATAFFNEHELIRDLLLQNNKINLIIRLGYPTSVAGVIDMINNGIKVKFFTSNEFHPKLYIYEDYALIGSANLTKAALKNNQEILAKINSDETAYQVLIETFNSYWGQATLLTPENIDKYENCIKKYSESINKNSNALSKRIMHIIGKHIYIQESIHKHSNSQTKASSTIEQYFNHWPKNNHEIVFFKLVSILNEMTIGISYPQIVFSFPKEDAIGIFIGNRRILRSHVDGQLDAIGMIMPISFKEKIRKYTNIKFYEDFSRNKIKDAIYVLYSPNNSIEINNEIIGYWKEAILAEIKKQYLCPFSRCHNDALHKFCMNKADEIATLQAY